MISLLGPPPPEFLERAKLSRKFFNEKGMVFFIVLSKYSTGVETNNPLWY